MNDDSFGDSMIVRGQREKSKKRENVLKRKSPTREREIIHDYTFGIWASERDCKGMRHDVS